MLVKNTDSQALHLPNWIWGWVGMGIWICNRNLSFKQAKARGLSYQVKLPEAGTPLICPGSAHGTQLVMEQIDTRRC